MKKFIFIFVFLTASLSALAQIELVSIDSSLKNIDKNISTLTEKLTQEVKSKNQISGQSMFEDKNGVSSIFLPQGGIFRLNTADASLKLAFIDKVSNRSVYYGFDISGKANNGLVSVFSSGMFSPGVKINGIIGLQELFSESDFIDGWLTLKLGYERSSFKLFNSNALFADQMRNKSFETPSGLLSLNLKFGGTTILAIGGGYRKGNNYDDLSELKLTDTRQFVNQSTNTTRSYSSTITVRSGEFNTYNMASGYIDLFWVPNNNPRIGFYHYYRPVIISGNVRSGAGTGFYLLKKKNPLAAIAGIVCEVPDFSLINDGLTKSFVVNFLIGYNFGL